MSRRTLRIGTRASLLALAQAGELERAVRERFPELDIERVLIRTGGDRRPHLPIPEIDGTGLFTRELEEALLAGRIDLAVHSLKDLPTDLPSGLVLGGVLERGEARDALVSGSGRRLDELDGRDVVATSSLRRRAQLLHRNRRPAAVDMRGNVDTRLRKMEQGACTALLLAAAGLVRTGLEGRITELLEPQVMLPAPAQGIIAAEVRAGDPLAGEVCRGLNHGATWTAAMAERAFLRRLEGGCRLPAGCLARVGAGGCTITGLIADPGGERVIRRSLEGPEAGAEALAVRLAAELLESGGAAILEAARGGLRRGGP